MKLYLEHETDTDKEIHFFYDFEEFKQVVKQEKIDLNQWFITYPDDTEEIYKQLFDGFNIDSDDLENFYELVESYDEYELLKVAMYLDYSYVSYNITTFDFDDAIDSIVYYEVDTLYDLAKQLYDEGMYEKVPDWLEDRMEFVYEAIEEQIEADWNEFENGSTTYRFFYKLK